MTDDTRLDEHLLQAWRDGDDRAGTTLVKRYFDLLQRFFRNKVRNPDDATDLVSETMLACARSRDRIDDNRSFRSYMFAIAMNALHQHLRKRSKRERERGDFAELCVAQAVGEGSPTHMLAQRQEAALLARALRRLPLDQQIVLELGLIEGLRPTQIAELLEVPENTVYTRRRRGKESLQRVLRQLSENEALVQSTVVGLETWAASIRAHLSPPESL